MILQLLLVWVVVLCAIIIVLLRAARRPRVIRLRITISRHLRVGRSSCAGGVAACTSTWACKQVNERVSKLTPTIVS